MTLSDWLRTQGWTQEQLAQAVGCEQATVSRIAAGKVSISLHLALKVQQVTDGQVLAETLPISQKSREALSILRAAA
jgi:transcriptional regulator with XRE-family HTH domain